MSDEQPTEVCICGHPRADHLDFNGGSCHACGGAAWYGDGELCTKFTAAIAERGLVQLQCADCGTAISEETGIVMESTLADGAPHRYYCPTCRPAKGYTLADLQAMKAENAIQRELARGNAELRIVEAGGMDVLGMFRSPVSAEHWNQAACDPPEVRPDCTCESPGDTYFHVMSTESRSDEPGPAAIVAVLCRACGGIISTGGD